MHFCAGSQKRSWAKENATTTTYPAPMKMRSNPVLRRPVGYARMACANAAVKPDMKPGEAAAARRAVMAKIEKESLDKTGLRSDVVTLYNGGLYHLYRYKKYTDVRLVFAPERQVASFGGDVDNFEYPRMDLDVAFFRAYENGTPAKTPHYFKWSETGPAGGDLVFVTGHPGTTNRLETLAKLKHRRDVTLPYTLNRLRTLEAAATHLEDRTQPPPVAGSAFDGAINHLRASLREANKALDDLRAKLDAAA